MLIGLLMAQYTYTGYDASAHVAEETHDAARAAPRGIVMSVVVSVIAGFVLLIAITWSIQDYEAERTTDLGLPPAQIFIDAAGHDLGHVPAVHLHGRAVVLRHGLGDRELPDGVRLLPRRRAARLADLEARSTRAPVRRPTRSGCA